MIEAIQCLIVENGYICLIDGEYEKSITDLKKEDISISFTEKGIVIVLKDNVLIPIPEDELDYFVDNSNITLYPFNPKNYVEKSIVTVSLSRDAVIEAKSIYNFLKAYTE